MCLANDWDVGAFVNFFCWQFGIITFWVFRSERSTIDRLTLPFCNHSDEVTALFRIGTWTGAGRRRQQSEGTTAELVRYDHKPNLVS